MTDWKKDLAQLAATVRQEQRAKKPVKNIHDLDENFRGRKGFSDSGIPLTEKTIKAKLKNRASYSRKNYAFSRLRFINDSRAESARQKRLEHPEYNKKISAALDHVDMQEAAAQKKRDIELKWADNKSRPSQQSSFYIGGRSYMDDYQEKEVEPVDYIYLIEKKEPEYTPQFSKDLNGNKKFKNKVDEEIYRLKKNEIRN